MSQPLTEANGCKVPPRYIIRDRDAVYGDVFIRRLRAMSIRDRPTAPRSPWQNGYCERAIGSIRRECLDRVVVFGERHLAICCDLTRPTTTRLARIFRSTKTRRRPEQYIPSVPSCLRHFSSHFLILPAAFLSSCPT